MPRSRLVIRLLDLLVIAPMARRRYLVGPLPATGPLLVAANHLSRFDPMVVGAAVTRAGRTPRLVDQTQLDAVREALRSGECVMLFGPDPTLGVLAAELAVPVAPVAQWGAQYLPAWRGFPPRRAKLVVTSLPVSPPPVDVGELFDAIDAAVLRLREVLEPVSAVTSREPARPARPALRRHRGDARS